MFTSGLSAPPEVLVSRLSPSAPSVMLLAWYLALLVQANPIPHGTSKPPTTFKSPSDPTTLIVTNDNPRRPAVTTRDGRRNAASSEGASSQSDSRRQAKKLSASATVDAEDLFREKVSNYPEEDIRRLLKQTPDSIKDLYNVINTQLDPHTNLTYRNLNYFNHEDEDGQGVREESVCLTKTRNIYPREANRQNSLVYIPNNQEFMQVIQAEICQHPDRECSYLQDGLPYGMTSVCYQKYAYKKLLYMDPLEKRMASDLFRYPSCCSCYIRTLPFDLRSSNNGTHASPKPTSSNAQSPPEPVAGAPQYLNGDSGTSASATNQTVDRSQNWGPQQQQPDGQQQRTSKQVKRPTNQTLVLTDDKVYSP